MRGILPYVLLIIPFAGFSQRGQITVVEDSSIQSVLKLYDTFAKEKRVVNGYRIQLGSNGNRKELLDMKARFLQVYPTVSAYIEYQQPQFKLRVGDFRTRGEANDFLEEIRINFPTTFIVPSKVYVEGIPW